MWFSLLQVYATITPIVHIVNVGSSVRESLANVTVCLFPPCPHHA